VFSLSLCWGLRFQPPGLRGKHRTCVTQDFHRHGTAGALKRESMDVGENKGILAKTRLEWSNSLRLMADL